MKNYAIVCGGTGGHISPGIAIAEELLQEGHKCTLIVSNKNIDNSMLRKYLNLKYIVIHARPFSRKPLKFLQFIFSQVRSLFFALSFLVKKRIDCVIGFGGFTNFSFVLAGFFLRKRLILHESNRVIGKSIKVLSLFADKIYLPQGMKFSLKFLNKKVEHAGYPLRKELVRCDSIIARKNIGFNKDNARLILVIGGSQGAKALTNWAMENYKILNKKGIFIYCLTGTVDSDLKGNIFKKFSDDMSMLYNSADIVISRAGAGTIAEVMFYKKPMILVPYPYAADDHQTKNAQYIESLGYGCWLPEKKIDNLTDLVIRSLNVETYSNIYDAFFDESAVFKIVSYATK